MYKRQTQYFASVFENTVGQSTHQTLIAGAANASHSVLCEKPACFAGGFEVTRIYFRAGCAINANRFYLFHCHVFESVAKLTLFPEREPFGISDVITICFRDTISRIRLRLVPSCIAGKNRARFEHPKCRKSSCVCLLYTSIFSEILYRIFF